MDDVARALPDYEILGELGRGEFGIVWGGRHRQLGREVAIKQLASGITSTTEYRARFRREARILAHVDHPHVVGVYDYREQDDLRLLVMELLPGGTLGDRRNAGITVETAIASTLAAASGLQCVHEQGILHRDVKPENLMFDRRSTLKVTDFGIARMDLVDATVLNVTHAGEFFGTPAYVAPEQAAQALSEGWPAIGTAADQYSLAAVLYEMLSGQLTHDASGGALALCTRRLHEEARPLRDSAPQIPAEIAAVVMRALARDPNLRHPSMEAFGVELATATGSTLGPDWLSRSDVQVREAGVIRDAALLPPSPPPAPPPAPPDPAPPRRRLTGLVVLAGIAILVVGLGSVFLLTRRGSDAPSSRGAAAAGDGPSTLTLTKAWRFPTGGVVFSSPAVSGSSVLVGSDDGSVYGIDAATGASLWKYATGGPVRSSPVVAGDHVYVGSDDGTLYALDLASGAILWSRPVGFEIVSSPLVSGGAVIVGADRLYAFDEATGAPRWTFAPGDTIVSSPAISGDTVVVGSNDHNLYGISLSSGTERWRLATGGAVQSSPAVADDDAYVGDLDGRLYSVVASTGVRRWATNLGSPVKSSPTVDDGTVYVGTDAGRLVAVDASRGRVRWTYAAPDRIDSSPVVLGNTVVVGSDDGNVYVVDARTGEQRGSFKTGGPVLSSPQVVRGGVVVGSNDGSVYKITGFAKPG